MRLYGQCSTSRCRRVRMLTQWVKAASLFSASAANFTLSIFWRASSLSFLLAAKMESLVFCLKNLGNGIFLCCSVASDKGTLLVVDPEVLTAEDCTLATVDAVFVSPKPSQAFSASSDPSL